MAKLDTNRAQSWVNKRWDDSIVPALTEYIRIPNKSPLFDANWQQNGHMEKAVTLVQGWCKDHALPGMSIEVMRIEGRTPLICMEIPGQGDDTVLLYGHLDKQPEMVGWAEGLGPWTPVYKNDRLYGRGGADDGYSAFASLSALGVLAEQGIPHARCVVLIEACEESGSYDLPYYIDALAERIGTPSLVVCLDSGCGNYEQLWSTTSLRGIVVANLTVEMLSEGVHSGDAGGIVPSTFRILRDILSRIEDARTGEIKIESAHMTIPKERVDQATTMASAMGKELFDRFPLVDGAKMVTDDPVELLLNGTWRPALAITGIEGAPALADAGNVLRTKTAIKLSMRVPPSSDCEKVLAELTAKLLADPPYGAKVTISEAEGADGWDAPPVAKWLDDAIGHASRDYFGREAVYMGEGGSIPFMGMLGEKFPQAQFLITGVLGPNSNAHGPNEFLHVPTGKKLTCCVAQVIADHFERQR